MKTRILLAAAVTFLVGGASPATAQSVTGVWQVESETRRGTQNITFDLVQDGSDLTGTATITMGGGRGRGGGGGGGAPTLDIEDGTVDGSSFSFGYTLSFNGNEVTFSVSGTYEGDEMQGTLGGGRRGGRGGGRPFTGVRGG